MKTALATVGLNIGEDVREIQFLPEALYVRYGPLGSESTAVIPWVYGDIRTEGINDHADSEVRLEVADAVDRNKHNKELAKYR